MIFNTEKAKKVGQMAPSMKATIWQVRSMVQVFTAGMTVANITETGVKTKLKVMVLTAGQMEDNIKDNGLIITWMTWVCTPGLTVDATWVNTKTTKSTDMVSTSGRMEDYIQDNGCVANNTVLVYTKLQRHLSNMVFGKKEKEQSGLMRQQQKKYKQARKISVFSLGNQKTLNNRSTLHLTNQNTSTKNSSIYKKDLASRLTISSIEINYDFLMKIKVHIK